MKDYFVSIQDSNANIYKETDTSFLFWYEKCIFQADSLKVAGAQCFPQNLLNLNVVFTSFINKVRF